jgi:hypothetical protein
MAQDDQTTNNVVPVFKCEKCKSLLWEGCKKCYRCGTEYVQLNEGD